MNKSFIVTELSDGDKWQELSVTKTPDGSEMVLLKGPTEYAIYVGNTELMASSCHSSEEVCAKLAFDLLLNDKAQDLLLEASSKFKPSKEPIRCLIGGLGMGFTLRAALDVAPENTSITVAELMPSVVTWNKGPLGHLADFPLNDPRVSVSCNDVRKVIPNRRHPWDIIILDVDNGPSACTTDSNDNIYGVEGLESIYEHLNPWGVLIVWSVGKDQCFEQRMRKVGFVTRTLQTPAVAKSSVVDMHTLFLARP